MDDLISELQLLEVAMRLKDMNKDARCKFNTFCSHTFHYKGNVTSRHLQKLPVVFEAQGEAGTEIRLDNIIMKVMIF